MATHRLVGLAEPRSGGRTDPGAVAPAGRADTGVPRGARPPRASPAPARRFTGEAICFIREALMSPVTPRADERRLFFLVDRASHALRQRAERACAEQLGVSTAQLG